MTDISQEDLNKQLQERFKQLPPIIQRAITSADVQKQLRELSDTNKLHLDQWQLLENEVMLTLLGFQPVDELAANLKTDLEITEELSKTLAENISKIVFEPIRQQLERELEHPDAKAATTTGVEDVRTQMMGEKETVPQALAPQPVVPATPPQPPPTEKVVRAPVSEAYKAGEVSSARRSIADDPYRESPA